MPKDILKWKSFGKELWNTLQTQNTVAVLSMIKMVELSNFIDL